MNRYRCPKCNNAITHEKVYDNRYIFFCKSCSIGTVINNSLLDEAYLDFLAMYDNNEIKHTDLEDLLVKESLIRSKKEIDSMKEADELTREVLYSKQDYVVYYTLMKEAMPEYGSGDILIDRELESILREKKIERLYRFQEEAIRKILEGKDIVIVAPTASGKTESFCLPILDKIKFEKGEIRALFIYPTKALARDQLDKIRTLASALKIRVAVLDGDSSEEERRYVVEERPEIILTNFDTIHYHLMYRTDLSRALKSVKYIVVDEAHVYTGVFGSHIHYIIKRLERITSRVQIVAASATLPNAKEFCEALFGREMDLVKGSGKRGRIHFAILFPTLRSHRALVLDLVKKLARDHKVIAFNDSHLSAELLAYYASRQGVKIRVHRAGLTQSYRRLVEESFKKGDLMAISSTPTLELGIDIGSVDGIVSGIVPIQRLMQRLGRAARRGQEGYAFLALGNDPISQYYMHHPDDYLNDQEYAYVDPENSTIKRYQILAMACDKPLTIEEAERYGIDDLLKDQLLIFRGDRYIADYRRALRYLHDVNIRGTGQNIDIILKGKRVGERSLPQALEELHDEAIYFLAGKRYSVKRLDLDKHRAEIVSIPNNYPYYTKALSEEWPEIEVIYDTRSVFNIEVLHCLLHIHKRVVGYANIEIGEAAKGKKVMLDKPLEYDFVTKGLIFRAPRPLDSISSADDPLYTEMSAYHASEHVVIEGSRMITGGASQDLGGISLGSSGLIFVYDSSIGGNGASRVLFERLERAFERGKDILSECPCKSESGCPRCTYSYRCGNNNEFLHKLASLEVYTRILGGEHTRVGSVEGDRSLV